MTENKYKGVVKEPCLLVPSHQSSDASGQFGLDFQGPISFELNLKLLIFSPMGRYACGVPAIEDWPKQAGRDGRRSQGISE